MEIEKEMEMEKANWKRKCQIKDREEEAPQ
jgi:hypothetical protein